MDACMNTLPISQELALRPVIMLIHRDQASPEQDRAVSQPMKVEGLLDELRWRNLSASEVNNLGKMDLCSKAYHI